MRLHWFELADLDGYPRTLAEAGHAYLRRLEELAKVDVPLAKRVGHALEESGVERWVDLASGAGGPAPSVRARLASEGRVVPLTLTDRSPDPEALAAAAEADGVDVHSEPVDATTVPESLPGLRTIFNALHHFPDASARAVLEDAVAKKQPILTAELSERTLPNVLSSILIPIFVLLIMPTVRPLRLSWIVFTYLIPILPLAIWWDGLVSHLRTHSPKELRALTEGLDDYEWTIGQDRFGPGKITWLFGRPRA